MRYVCVRIGSAALLRDSEQRAIGVCECALWMILASLFIRVRSNISVIQEYIEGRSTLPPLSHNRIHTLTTHRPV